MLFLIAHDIYVGAYGTRPELSGLYYVMAEVCCMVRAALHRAYAIRPYKPRISQCGAVVYGEILAVAYRAYAIRNINNQSHVNQQIAPP